MKEYVKMVVFLAFLAALSAAALTACNDLIRSRIEINKKKDKVIHILKVFQILPAQTKLDQDTKIAALSAKIQKASGIERDKLILERAAKRIELTEHTLKQLSMDELKVLFAQNVDKVMELNPEEHLPTGVKRMRIWSGKQFIDLPSSEIDTIHKLYLYRTHKADGYIYAFEVTGTGFWDKISGFMALRSGLLKMYGISFFDHKETPGLGQRIEEGWFQAQFRIWNKQIFPDQVMGHPQLSFTRSMGINGYCKAKKPNVLDAITGASETSRALDGFLDENLYTLFKSLSMALSNKKRLAEFLAPRAVKVIEQWKSKSSSS